jgi:RimJ/RimL family protein N-acetyltransferase
MVVIETGRLELRRLQTDDAPFVLELFNEPSFLHHIGDRGIRSEQDARRYIVEGPVASYLGNGFGLWLVQRRGGGEPLGICGLVRRDYLDDVDVGFAFLPRHWSRGYALEAARAVLDHARGALGLRRIAAIVSPGNGRSIRLLERLGLSYERPVRPPHAQSAVHLYSIVLVPET